MQEIYGGNTCEGKGEGNQMRQGIQMSREWLCAATIQTVMGKERRMGRRGLRFQCTSREVLAKLIGNPQAKSPIRGGSHPTGKSLH